MITSRAAGAACAAVLVAAATAAAQTGAPSLAEIARQTEAQRRANPRPSRVYTNGDLVRIVEPVPSPPPVSGGFVSKTTGETVSGDEIVARSAHLQGDTPPEDPEPRWRQRAGQLRAERDQAQARVDGLRDGPPLAPGVQRERDRLLAQAEAYLADVEGRWQQFVAAAAKANIPKGWLEP